jgi:VanZ family protein
LPSSPLTFNASSQTAPRPTSLLLSAWLPVVACLLIFAIESTRMGGTDRTSAPLRHVAEGLFGFDNLAYWEPIHHAIRKTGHFMGYGIFSLVCFRAFRMIQRKPARRLGDRLSAHGLAIAATFLIASADEFHQTFLPNRTGCFSDVLLDTSGAVALGLALFVATVVPPLVVAFFRPAPVPVLIPDPTRREDDQAAPVQEKGPALV